MEGNQWISTLNALKVANKEKDEFIAAMMGDLADCEGERQSYRKRAEELEDMVLRREGKINVLISKLQKEGYSIRE